MRLRSRREKDDGLPFGTEYVPGLGVVSIAQPRIDSLNGCKHCGGPVIWDEVYGWLHVSGWYACRWPHGGSPREVMAAPAGARS